MNILLIFWLYWVQLLKILCSIFHKSTNYFYLLFYSHSYVLKCFRKYKTVLLSCKVWQHLHFWNDSNFQKIFSKVKSPKQNVETPWIGFVLVKTNILQHGQPHFSLLRPRENALLQLSHWKPYNMRVVRHRFSIWPSILLDDKNPHFQECLSLSTVKSYCTFKKKKTSYFRV